MSRVKTALKVFSAIGTVGTIAGWGEKYQDGYQRKPFTTSDLAPWNGPAKLMGMFHRSHNDLAEMRGRWGDIDHWNELTKDNPRLPPWLKKD